MEYKNFLQLVSKRKSCRNYDDEEVPDSLLEKCIEAARLSPSACNKQPWRFVIVKEKNTRIKIFKKGLLPFLPMPWFMKAPVIIALCAATEFTTHKFAPMLSGIDYKLIDLGIAGEHFVLAAESLGLGTCWIGWFKEKKVKKILDIPKNIKIASLITVGYPVDNEPNTKEKLPLDKVTFYEKWNQQREK
ncbi:MAG: nitroreductase family protein [Victivallales bacterium]|nr:nitroreductase family protein [Victivallales bacterium]